MPHPETPAQSVALFTGPDGSVRMLWAAAGDPWSGPAAIAPAGTCAPGTPVGLARHPATGGVDAAYVGADGSVQVMWAVRSGGWRAPRAVAPPGTCAPGAAVTLAYQPSLDQLDALFTGADGSVQVMRPTGGPWSGPAEIAPPGSCAPGTPVGLGHRPSAGLLDALYAGADGSVRGLLAAVDHPWTGPAVLAPPGTCVPGTAVTLAYEDANGRSTALFTGADGSVQVLRAAGGAPWDGPAPVAPPGTCAPGSPVALAHRPAAGRSDAVVTGADGSLQSLWTTGEQGWSGPVALAPAGTCAPGTAVGLGRRAAAHGLDAVFPGADGSVRAMWAERDGGWHAPVVIAPPRSAVPGSGVTVAHRTAAHPA